MQTLTQVQQDAIDYSLRTKRPNDHRVTRKAGRMVREYCQEQGYTEDQTRDCVRDMFDMVKLERLCNE